MKRILFISLIAAGLTSVPACKKAKTPTPAKPAAGTPAAPATPGAQAQPGQAQPAAATPAVPGEVQPAQPGQPVKEPVVEAPARERIQGPVAKVNGTDIKGDEFYAELDKITARNAKIPPDRLARIEQNILKRLIEKELINQAIAKANIAVKDDEIDSAFTEYKKRFQSEDQFQNYLKHGRVTIDSIKQRLREKRALEKLIEAKGDLAVDDKEAKEFYEKNSRFYVEKSGVRARHVLVKVPQKATADQEKAAMAKVKQVQAELKKGTDFAAVAKKFSEGPSAPKGGDLGFFGPGQMVKPFEEAAFKMKVGDVSGPIRTRFGFHIIKVEDKREERKKPFKEVSDQIVKSLKNKKFFQERRKLLQDLQKDAKVEKFLPEPPPVTRPTGGHGTRPAPRGAAPVPTPAGAIAAPAAPGAPAAPVAPVVKPAVKPATPAPAAPAAPAPAAKPPGQK